jgi:hypothetical protein
LGAAVVVKDVNGPRGLTMLWGVVLLAPFAWAASLGLMFALTERACVSGSRVSLLVTAVLAVALAAAPGVVVWGLRGRTSVGDDAHERARFQLGLAAGGSAIFTLVTVVSAVPIFLLHACRT